MISVKVINPLISDGEVWTVGVNNFGQLGHHETRNRPVFSRVEGLPPVKQLAVGSYHCAVLTKDGQVWPLSTNVSVTIAVSKLPFSNMASNWLAENCPPPPLILCEWYHFVQGTLRNHISDVTIKKNWDSLLISAIFQNGRRKIWDFQYLGNYFM